MSGSGRGGIIDMDSHVFRILGLAFSGAVLHDALMLDSRPYDWMDK